MNALDTASTAALTDRNGRKGVAGLAAVVLTTLSKQPWSVVLIAHAAQLGFLLWIAAHAIFCCDASAYYIPAGNSIFHDGLLWNDPYAGYRFYFVPLVFGLLEKILRAFAGAERIPTLLPFALAIIFFVTSLLASLHVFRREGRRRWSLFAIPLLFNPFILAVVPYPIQESVVFIFCMPLLLLLLAATASGFRTICTIAVLFVGFAFIARSSLLWVAVPALLLVVQKALWLRPAGKHVVQGAALVIAISATLIAPQSYISWHKFGAFNPLAQTWVGRDQVVLGIETLNRSTTIDNHNVWDGFPVRSPYQNLESSEKTLAFYLHHPQEGVFLALTHIWSGLHYVAVTPYIPKSALVIFSWSLLSSSLVVAFGVLGLQRLFAQPEDRGVALFLLALTLLSCAYTAFVATENRFGLLGLTALSVAAWQLLMNPNERGFCLRALPLVIAYVCLCVIINALLLYRTAVLWPGSPSHARTGTTDLPAELCRDVAMTYSQSTRACPQFPSRLALVDTTAQYTSSIARFI